MSTETNFENVFTVTTDLDDYAPGETAMVTASGVVPGGTVEFRVQHVDGAGDDGIFGTADDRLDAGADGVYGTADDGTGPNPGAYASDHAAFTVTDGVWWWEAGADGVLGTGDDVVAGDLDQAADGTIVTSWLVRDPDSADETFLLSAHTLDPADGSPAGAAFHGFTDSAGAYTINFAAADPALYIPAIPYPVDVTPIVGRGDGETQIPGAWFIDPVTLVDVHVESLAPEGMALGQVVPFLFRITVDGDTSVEDGTITFTAGWDTVAQNGDDFGFDEALGVIAAFVDTGDGAHDDPGADALVDAVAWSLVGTEIQGVFTVTGLDDGDVVVVEAWLVLEDEIPENTGSVVPSRLIEASTAPADPAAAVTINTGNQTVPLNRLQAFETAEADLAITKTDLVDPVAPGGTLTYEITVTNNGPAVANGVTVTDALDPNVTYLSADNGGSYSDNGTPEASDDTVSWDIGALAVGQSVTLTVTVQVNDDAPSGGGADLVNTVEVTAITLDPLPDNNVASEPTDVVDPQGTSFQITKALAAIDGDPLTTDVTAAGQVLSYVVTLVNDGDVALTGVTLDDTLADALGAPVESGGGGVNGDGIFDVGETWTWSYDYEVTPDDIASLGGGDGDIDNTATADTDQTGSKSASVEVPVLVAELEIRKQIKVGDTWLDADGDPALLPLLATRGTLEYRIILDNTGTVELTDVIVWDPEIGLPQWHAYEVGSIAAGGQVILGVGEICRLEVCWQEGVVINTAYADSLQTDEVSDVAGYFGAIACIDVDKVTIAGPDNIGDNLVVEEGAPLTWQYTVTNTGNVDITGLTLFDDAGTWDEGDDFDVTNLVSGDDVDPGVLNVGEVWVFEATGVATGPLTGGGLCGDDGAYVNHVVVEAEYTDAAGLTRDLKTVDTSSYTLAGQDGGKPPHDGPHDGPDGGHPHGSWTGGGDHDDHWDGCGDDDWFRGNKGDDEMRGRHGNDRLAGNHGNDHVYGNHGRDLVFGGQGDDHVYGGRGNDHVHGGKGFDKLWGGAGCDVFAFQDRDGQDRVFDFDAKGARHDVIDLSEVSGIGGWQDLRDNHLEETDRGIWIRCDSVEVFLKGVEFGHLDAGDFVF